MRIVVSILTRIKRMAEKEKKDDDDERREGRQMNFDPSRTLYQKYRTEMNRLIE
jgi:hypothetical protein